MIRYQTGTYVEVHTGNTTTITTVSTSMLAAIALPQLLATRAS